MPKNTINNIHSRSFAKQLFFAGLLVGMCIYSESVIAQVDCSGKTAWNVADHWTTYSVGDQRKHNGNLYQVHAVTWVNEDPSGPNGHWSWTYVNYCATGPTVSAGSAATICKGSSRSLGGSPTASGGTSPYTYAWAASSGAAPAATANPSVSPTVSTTYTVTVTDASAATGTSSVAITVNNPTATYSNACVGQTLQLNCAQAGGTYSWNTSGSAWSSTSQNPTRATADAAMNGTYTVTATLNTVACTSTMSVTVNALPTPTISGNNNSSICAGSPAAVSLTASGGSSYVWSNSLGTGNPVSVSPTANATYTVTATDANGCSNTATHAVRYKTGGVDKTIVASTPTTLTASGAQTGYLWSTTETTNAISVSPAVQTTYTITIDNGAAASCVDQVVVSITAYSCTTCDVNVSGATNYSVGANNQNYCLASGTWTGNITFGAYTGTKICIAGTWNPLTGITATQNNTIIENVGIINAPTIALHSGTGIQLLNQTTGTVNITTTNAGVGGTLIQSGSTITNYGIYISNGFASITGLIDNKTGGVIIDTSNLNFTFASGAPSMTNNGTIRKNGGNISFQAVTPPTTFTNNGLIWNHGTGTFTSQNGANIVNSSSGVINNANGVMQIIGSGSNAGMIINTGNLSLTNTVPFPNTGTMFIKGAGNKVLSVNGGVNNSGRLTIEDGDLEVVNNGDFLTNNGVITLQGAGRSVLIGLGGTASVTNNGRIIAPNMEVRAYGTLNNYCSVELSGNFNMTSSLSIVTGPTSAGEVGKITVAGTSTYTASGTFGGAGQNIDFCDASLPTGGFDGSTDPASWAGLTFCTAAANGNATCDQILPIHLFYFKANCNDASAIELHWATLSETNNDRFVIERSEDGINFDVISSVKGAGNSNRRLFYSITDVYESTAQLYYRLSQIDHDGKSETFPVTTVSCASEMLAPQINISPNPADDDELNFSIEGIDVQELHVMVYDAIGRAVYLQDHMIESNVKETVNFRKPLASGMYVIRLTSPHINATEKFFVKQ